MVPICNVAEAKVEFPELAAANPRAKAEPATTSNVAMLTVNERSATRYLLRLRATGEPHWLAYQSFGSPIGVEPRFGIVGPGIVPYWLMLQVNGKVAVKPWSALVAVESSWTDTTYVAEEPAARAVIGVVPKV